MSGHARLSVLVADHDQWTRLELAKLVHEAGFGVTQASNGVAALRIAEIAQPQIVLLRHNLPEIGAILVGVTQRAELEEIFAAIGIGRVLTDARELAIEDSVLLDPTLW